MRKIRYRLIRPGYVKKDLTIVEPKTIRIFDSEINALEEVRADFVVEREYLTYIDGIPVWEYDETYDMPELPCQNN